MMVRVKSMAFFSFRKSIFLAPYIMRPIRTWWKLDWWWRRCCSILIWHLLMLEWNDRGRESYLVQTLDWPKVYKWNSWMVSWKYENDVNCKSAVMIRRHMSGFFLLLFPAQHDAPVRLRQWTVLLIDHGQLREVFFLFSTWKESASCQTLRKCAWWRCCQVD